MTDDAAMRNDEEDESTVLESIRAVRVAKVDRLREAGVEPYPSGPVAKTMAADAVGLDDGTAVTVAGRIMALRVMGNVAFGRLHDESGDIQFMLSKRDLVPTGEGVDYKGLLKLLDVGDIIAVDGTRTTTKTGEPTVGATTVTVLAKSLRPLPDKHAGIANEDVLLRKRYLDILLHREVQEMIYKKATFWRSTRRFLEGRGFVEVATPVLEHTTGGADARPFVTHHNFLGVDVALRISMGELWQKRLLVGGLEKVFEIGRQFRNESQSREHANDYEQMEFYWAYANHELGMALVEDLFKTVVAETWGTLRFSLNRHGRTFDVDLGAEWERYDFVETIDRIAGIDIRTASDDELRKAAGDDGDDEVLTRARAIDRIWKRCRREIAGPGFLVNEPVELSPLAKRSAAQPDIAERFHVLIAGSELGNGYSELNDPIDQAARFAQQQAMRDAGDLEAQQADHEFVEALEYGMPPAVGFGMSERVFAFFMDKSLREAQIFPLLKPT
jgi:lysyl-tRNA synthetase class 2